MNALLRMMLAKSMVLAGSQNNYADMGDADARNTILQDKANEADKKRANLQAKILEDENNALDNFDC